MKKDRLVGFILVAISVLFLAMTYKLPKSKFTTTVGPDVFPYMASGGLLLCAIGLILKRDDGRKEDPPFLDRAGWLRVARLGVLLVSFPFLFHWTGFIVAALAFLFLMIRMFDLDKEVSPRKTALVVVVVTTALYTLSTYLLKIQLPRGLLFQLIKG